jgi:hypothetical protein
VGIKKSNRIGLPGAFAFVIVSSKVFSHEIADNVSLLSAITGFARKIAANTTRKDKTRLDIVTLLL